MNNILTMSTERMKTLAVMALVALISSMITFGFASVHPVSKAHASSLTNVRDLEIVWGSNFYGSNLSLTENCPAGKVAIGGGVLAGNGQVAESRPAGPSITGFTTSGDVIGNTSNETGWFGRVANDNQGLTVYAMCATAQ